MPSDSPAPHSRETRLILDPVSTRFFTWYPATFTRLRMVSIYSSSTTWKSSALRRRPWRESRSLEAPMAMFWGIDDLLPVVHGNADAAGADIADEGVALQARKPLQVLDDLGVDVGLLLAVLQHGDLHAVAHPELVHHQGAVLGLPQGGAGHHLGLFLYCRRAGQRRTWTGRRDSSRRLSKRIKPPANTSCPSPMGYSSSSKTETCPLLSWETRMRTLLDPISMTAAEWAAFFLFKDDPPNTSRFYGLLYQISPKDSNSVFSSIHKFNKIIS